MGEIGISRKEFLYDIKFWEARRIFRGYRKRHHFLYQLIAEDVFASTYAFRGSKGNTPQKMFPMLFEDDDDYEMEPAITQEEQDELQALMAAENARLSQQKSSEE